MSQINIGDKVKVKNYKHTYVVGSVVFVEDKYDLALYSTEGRDMLEIVVSPDDIEVI